MGKVLLYSPATSILTIQKLAAVRPKSSSSTAASPETSTTNRFREALGTTTNTMASTSTALQSTTRVFAYPYGEFPGGLNSASHASRHAHVQFVSVLTLIAFFL